MKDCTNLETMLLKEELKKALTKNKGLKKGEMLNAQTMNLCKMKILLKTILTSPQSKKNSSKKILITFMSPISFQ